MRVNNAVTGVKIDADKTAEWANNALVNTAVEKTFTKNAQRPTTLLYKLIVDNPSTVTDLTVEIYDAITGEQDSYITTVTIPKKATRANGKAVQRHVKYITGLFCGTGTVKLVLSNDTVLGVADTFTATIRLREVI